MSKYCYIPTVVIPLALGNPLKEDCNGGAYRRFIAGINKESLGNTLVIQTAGYSKAKPKESDISHPLPLSGALLKKLRDERNPWADRFIARALGWGTASEIKFAFKVIRQLKIGSRLHHKKLRVVIASNKVHLIRIKLYVAMYRPKDVIIQYKVAKHDFSTKDTFRELKAIGGDVPIKLWQRLKVWRRLRRRRKNQQQYAFSPALG